jgi:hypothetical protein
MADLLAALLLVVVFCALPVWAVILVVQFRRFATGPTVRVEAFIHWHHFVLGFGWRLGTLKLEAERLQWRRRFSVRVSPAVDVARSSLSFVGRGRGARSERWAILGGDVIELEYGGKRIELGLARGTAELLLDWLEVSAPGVLQDRQHGLGWVLSAGLAVLITAGAVFGGGVGFDWGHSWPQLLTIPGIALASIIAAVVSAWVQRRDARPAVRKSEFVSATRGAFDFLDREEGFASDVDYLPWRTTVLYQSTNRYVAAIYDSRHRRVEVRFGPGWHPQADDSAGESGKTVIDLLRQADDPNPERVTNVQPGEDGMRQTMEANAHALRLYARDFVKASTR